MLCLRSLLVSADSTKSISLLPLMGVKQNFDIVPSISSKPISIVEFDGDQFFEGRNFQPINLELHVFLIDNAEAENCIDLSRIYAAASFLNPKLSFHLRSLGKPVNDMDGIQIFTSFKGCELRISD